jgi:hypothetical protein
MTVTAERRSSRNNLSAPTRARQRSEAIVRYPETNQAGLKCLTRARLTPRTFSRG